MPRVQVPFWDYVQKTDGCWLWLAGSSGGYGRYRFKGHNLSAHRVSFLLVHGEIPPGMCVCHRCDTPLCVRPDHLFLGSKADNNADRHAKGRSKNLFAPGQDHPHTKCSGEKSWFAKLSDRDVSEIRARRGRGELHREIAASFGVNPATISRIARGIWRAEASR